MNRQGGMGVVERNMVTISTFVCHNHCGCAVMVFKPFIMHRSRYEDHKKDAKTSYTVNTEVIRENSARVDQRSESKVSTPVT